MTNATRKRRTLYRITIHHPNGTGIMIIRYQKPAAFLQFQRTVYSVIRSYAGLDTAWGVRAMAQTEGAAEDTSFYEVRVQDSTVRFERETINPWVS